MKTILNLLIASTLIISCGNQLRKPKNDLAKMNLFGNVNQLTELTYKNEYYFLGISPETDITDRNMTKLKLSEKNIYRFNTDGNYLETQDIYIDPPDSIYLKLNNQYFYEYNSAGLLNKSFYPEKNTVESRYEFDKRGNLIKIESFINSQPIQDKTEYKYNQKNQLIEIIEFDSSSTPKSKWVFRYDNRGNKTESIQYTRRKNNQLLFNFKRIYTVDSSGNCIEEQFIYRNNLATKSIYTYDRFGNTISTIKFSATGEPTYLDSSVYLYDYNNNWIKRTKYTSLFPKYLEPGLSEIIQRIFEYY